MLIFSNALASCRPTSSILKITSQTPSLNLGDLSYTMANLKKSGDCKQHNFIEEHELVVLQTIRTVIEKLSCLDIGEPVTGLVRASEESLVKLLRPKQPELMIPVFPIPYLKHWILPLVITHVN